MYKISLDGKILESRFDTLESVLAWVDIIRSKDGEVKIAVYHNNNILEVF